MLILEDSNFHATNTVSKNARYLFSMNDEESHSARKRMWKITSGVFIVFFLIALKRAIK